MTKCNRPTARRPCSCRKGLPRAGVSAARLKITPIVTAGLSLPASLTSTVFAYRLEPDGLHFSSPVVISVATNLPASQPAPKLFTISGKTIEALTPVATELDPQMRNVVLVAAVHYFSTVIGLLPWSSCGAARFSDVQVT